MTRQWTINGRFLAQPITGVQRYAREIVTALDALICTGGPLTEGLDVQLIAPPNADLGSLPLRAIECRKAGAVSGHIWEQTTLAVEAKHGLLSLCNLGPLATTRQIVCIHDVNTRVVPRSYSRSFRAAYRIILPALARRARKVTTVSDYSSADLIRFGIASADKMMVVPNGHEHAARWKPLHSEATRGAVDKRTIILLGSSIPHKNAGLILSLQARLQDAGLRIAVVGNPDPRVFQPEKAAAASNITWLGRVSDDQLAAVLQDSLCLAFPSLAEGFGLPPLEAMAIGCPVVASDRASMPEICGDAAIYASALDPDAWMNGFMKLKWNPSLRHKMIGLGRERARRFSWTISAERYLSLMAEVDGVSDTRDNVCRPGLTDSLAATARNRNLQPAIH